MATVFQPLEQDNYIAKLIDGVSPEWRSEFQRFVETGEAEEAFLSYLNEDATAQDAVEKAFNYQVTQFEGLAAELKKRQGHEQPVGVTPSTSTKLAAVVEAVMQTPREQRDEVVKTSTAELAASMPAEDRKVLKEVARSLENNLAKLADATHR